MRRVFEPHTVLERMAAAPHGAILAVQVLHRAIRSSEGSELWILGTDVELEPWASHSRDMLADKFRRHVELVSSHPADAIGELQRDLLLFWNALAPEQARTWVRDITRAGIWDLLALLIRLSRPDMYHPDRITADLDLLDRLVGLNYIKTELATEIAASPVPLAPDATDSQRILNALHTIKTRPRAQIAPCRSLNSLPFSAPPLEAPQQDPRPTKITDMINDPVRQARAIHTPGPEAS
ncbi:MAG TPA: hypothetical protein VGD71_29085, partial [Kribbella sp.]